jgi:ribosomal protein S24E
MELKIIEENENPLFKRKEVVVAVEAESVPSNAEVAKALAEKFSSPEEAIRVRTIKGNFGVKEFKIVANIYGSKEDLEATEQKSKKDASADVPSDAPEGTSEGKAAPESAPAPAPNEATA